MSHRSLAAVTALTVVLWVLLLAPGPAGGQAFWREDTPKIPMATTWLTEKAELPPYSPPRTPDGVPDLQGVWGGAGGDGLSYLEDHEYVDVTTPAQESFVSDPPDGKVPYTPWGLAKRNEILAGLGRGWPGESGERLYSSPSAYCLNYMPRFSLSALEIVQQPGSVIMLGEEGYRMIPTDGRPPIGEDAKFWFGNSRGHWEGDTLVVEVTSLNGRGWFDSTGHYYTENTRMTERWRLADADRSHSYTNVRSRRYRGDHHSRPIRLNMKCMARRKRRPYDPVHESVQPNLARKRQQLPGIHHLHRNTIQDRNRSPGLLENRAALLSRLPHRHYSCLAV